MEIRGLLLDLEGVLYQEDAAIQGARAAVAELLRQGLKIRFLTNTTTQPRARIVERLSGYGIPVEADQLFTPALAAAALLRRGGLTRLHLAAPAALTEDFAGFELVSEEPDAVVLGDLFRAFTWDRLNSLFAMVQNGARLIALHRNRYCTREGSLGLDLGPFVAALEYACATQAIVVGKPSPDFFKLAVDDLGLSETAAVMVGDDLESDIAGAQNAGLRAIQVETGKFRTTDLDHPKIAPNRRIRTVADLPSAVQSLSND